MCRRFGRGVEAERDRGIHVQGVADISVLVDLRQDDSVRNVGPFRSSPRRIVSSCLTRGQRHAVRVNAHQDVRVVRVQTFDRRQSVVVKPAHRVQPEIHENIQQVNTYLRWSSNTNLYTCRDKKSPSLLSLLSALDTVSFDSVLVTCLVKRSQIVPLVGTRLSGRRAVADEDDEETAAPLDGSTTMQY
jgi:hypothetical protein